MKSKLKSHNLRDIWTVAKFTMRDLISRKSFRISTIIILIMIVIGCNAPKLIEHFAGDSAFENNILIVDRDQIFNDTLTQLDGLDTGTIRLSIGQDDDEAIKTKISNGDITAAIVLTDSATPGTINLDYIVKNTATAAPLSNDLLYSLTDLYRTDQLLAKGLSAQDIQAITPEFQINLSQTTEQEIGGEIGAVMMLSLVLFLAIYLCAFQVSSSITIEKTSKIIETLVTSTSPRTIIVGKTLGIGLVGLAQILLFVTVALICVDRAILAALFDMSKFTPFLAIITLIYFILGYFGYAFAYALAGSTVSKPEEIQAANTPIVLVTVFGFYLSYFTLLDPTSSLNSIAALLPISSPFCMPLRVMMGVASSFEIILSVILLIAFCIIVANIAIKIYSNAILNYGRRITLQDMIKLYKEK